MNKPGNLRSLRTIEVIETETVTGKGVDHDPIRALIQYWSKDGELLATVDPWLDCVKPSIKAMHLESERLK